MDDQLNAPLDEFKERELEILTMMAQGMTNAAIADQLFITKETVRWYNKQIYSKLGTSRRTEAIALGRRFGLIEDPDAAAPPSPEKTTVHRLPAITGPFIGRDDEMADLAALLEQPETRLLTIIAAGGMGKSRLSLELGHSVKANYAHGAAFVDLTPLRQGEDVAVGTLSALGQNADGNQPPMEALLNYCREKHILLIFDNFEHVLDGAALLPRILEGAPDVQIIVTSREQLNLRAEMLYYLKPVTESGGQLFVEIATMMRPNVEIGANEWAAVDRIVDLVGGSPLGLTLAATWIDTLPIPEIAEEIEASLDFLSAEMGDMPERQSSIHAVIDPTWRRLDEREQNAFARTSVFRGGFTRAAFKAVTGASVRTLQTLINRSLVSHGHGRRYDLHPLLRQYAREKLEAANMLGDAKATHLATFRTYAEEQAALMFNGGYMDALEALETEQDNLRAALDWAGHGHSTDDGVALAIALGEYWLIRSQVSEGLAHVERLTRHAAHPRLYYYLSVFLYRIGAVEQSMAAAEMCIQEATASGDRASEAYGLLRLINALDSSEIDTALRHIEAAFEIGNQLDDSHLLAMLHNIYANLLSSGERLTESRHHHYEKALELYEQRGDLRGISIVTNNLALAQFLQPDEREQARELMQYSLQLKRQIGDQAGEARRLTTMSLWAIEEEAFDDAKRWLGKSREILEEIGDQERLAYTSNIEGLMHMAMTDFEAAAVSFGRCRDICISTSDVAYFVENSAYLAFIAGVRGDTEAAWTYLEEGASVEHTTRSAMAMWLVAYANTLWRTRDIEASTRVAAVMRQGAWHPSSLNRELVERYQLKPLVNRIQHKVGQATWEAALANTANIDLVELFGEIAADLRD